MTQDYDNIIPTAWIVAYRRTFSDIPFSGEIFDSLDALREERFGDITDKMLRPELSPQYEARQKIIDKYVLSTGAKNILEMAAGFTGRGMSMTADSRITYVELDLPRVMQDKTAIANLILTSQELHRPNLYFESGNALDYEALQKAATHFSQGPITIVNEGFLRYLSFDEKETVARNVHRLLENYGGQWITSDITLKSLLAVEDNMSKHNRAVASVTGIDVNKNRFENEEQAQSFFEGLGFRIERHSFAEVKDELVSPKKLDLSDEAVNRLIDSAVVYIMRPQ
ncbi:MAG: class I SAM-dependent methyltransferase [Candidatus Heimdallarchaeaceae archaeon]